MSDNKAPGKLYVDIETLETKRVYKGGTTIRRGRDVLYYHKDLVDKMVRLAELKGEYIKLLEKSISRLAGIAFPHGYGGDVEGYELGLKLREQIGELEKEINHE